MSAFDGLEEDLRNLGNALSPFFKAYQLTFPGVDGALVQDGATGNWVPGPGVDVQVTCRLKVTTDPQFIELPGVDRQGVLFVGHFGTLAEPQVRPEGLPYGSSCPLAFGGTLGRLTLLQALPSETTLREHVQGERFLAIWRS